MIGQISREGGIPVILSVLASLHNGLTSSVKEKKNSDGLPRNHMTSTYSTVSRQKSLSGRYRKINDVKG